MNKQELFEAIANQFAILSENNDGTTKASQARARKAAGEIKKLITPYKKASMDEVKGQGVSLSSTKSPRANLISPSGNGGVFFYWHIVRILIEVNGKFKRSLRTAYLLI